MRLRGRKRGERERGMKQASIKLKKPMCYQYFSANARNLQVRM